MPKLKTHSGTKDKIRVTKNGKMLARRGGGHHFLAKKSEGRKRGYAGMQALDGKKAKTLKKRLAI